MRALRLVLPLVLLAAIPAQAAAADLPYRVPPGTTPPSILPVRGATAARVQTAGWLVGARPGREANRVAARYGAQLLSPRGIYLVSRARAGDFATALRIAGVYRFAEPNRKLERAQAGGGVDEFAATDWRAFLVPAGLTPPPVSQAPLTAVPTASAWSACTQVRRSCLSARR
jgi:hypothetical protein